MARDELEEFQYLWNGTDQWVLHATYYSRVVLEIVFAGEHATITEIIAVRKLLDEYRHIPVHEVKSKIGNCKVLSIGEYSTMEAEWVLRDARKLGLTIAETDVSYTTYLPFNDRDLTVFTHRR